MNGLIARADALAERAHRTVGQLRKYTAEPYIVHPRAVAEIVKGVRWSTPEMIAAALLHDVLEDTDISYQEVKAETNWSVAMMVRDLTDEFVRPSQGNREERKLKESERLSRCDAFVQTIKVADLIDNTKSIVAYDLEFAKVYLKEKARLLDCLYKADTRLVHQARELVRHGQALILEASTTGESP